MTINWLKKLKFSLCNMILSLVEYIWYIRDPRTERFNVYKVPLLLIPFLKKWQRTVFRQARPNSFFGKKQMSQDEFDRIFILCWFYPLINITAQKPFGFSKTLAYNCTVQGRDKLTKKKRIVKKNDNNTIRYRRSTQHVSDGGVKWKSVQLYTDSIFRLTTKSEIYRT